jgi:hypothetical protein
VPPPATQVPNDQVVYTTSCESWEVLTYTGTLPAWITFDAETNRVYGAAGTFYRDTKSAANAAAQAALDTFVQDSFASGDFACVGFQCLSAWWKADAIVASDDDPLAQWDDSTGNGRHLTQATGAFQPLYKTNLINSTLPAVRFGRDATFRFFELPRFYVSFTEGEIIMVSKAQQDPSVGPDKYGWMSIGGTTASDYYASSSALFTSFGSPDRRNTADLGGILDEWNVIDVFSLVRGATKDYQIIVNGTSMPLGGVAASSNIVAWATVNESFIGRANTSFTQFFYGDIAEIMFFDCVLEAEDRARVLAYLQTKYGL